MKVKLTILVLMTAFFGTAQNKFNGVVKYNVSQKKRDLSDLEKKAENSTSSQGALSILKNARDVISVLKFTEDESLYAVEKKLQNEIDGGVNITKMFAGGTDTFYGNKKEGDYFSTSNSIEKGLLVENSKADWELLNETKKIGKYTCHKAIYYDPYKGGLSNTVAWYTLEIPIAFGPLEYHGLPGLILELETKLFLFTAIEVKLNTLKFKKIKKPTGKKITQKQYRNRTKDFFKE